MATKSQPASRDQDVTSGGNVIQATPFQRMLRAMELEATAEVENAVFSGDNLNGILNAETEEELWEADERGPLNGQHLAGCELSLIKVTVKFSRAGRSDEISSAFVTGEGRKMYLIVDAVRLSEANDKGNLIRLPEVGEVFQFNTSATFLTAKIWAFYTRGYIDADSGKQLECVVKEIDLGDGQAVLKLRPMPRRSVRTET
jgi:hypothetical protein